MKKIASILFSLFVASFAVQSQCPVTDSTLMGAGTANDVYYSLKNGVVKTISNKNWHLAFSVMRSQFPGNPSTGVAVRLNSAGNNMKLVRLPATQNPANWRNIDTTGMYALPELIDSDSTWFFTAFTKGYTSADPFNFIWGAYNMSTKHVDGTNVYIMFNKADNIYKKVFIKQVSFDSMWSVVVSNLDNTDSNFVQIRKNAYPNRMFVYYNAVTNEVLDREPANNSWDLVWTKFTTFAVSTQGSGLFPLSGVLSNLGVQVAKNVGKKCDQVWLSTKTAQVNPKISLIGGDWKLHLGGGVYAIADTFVYFVTAANTTYKLTFKGFAGGALGKSTFNLYEATLSTNELSSTPQIKVVPNPINGLGEIITDSKVEKITIQNLQGQVILENSLSNSFDISNYASGIYLMTVQTDKGLTKLKLIKQ
jgi:hypothetical protein